MRRVLLPSFGLIALILAGCPAVEPDAPALVPVLQTLDFGEVEPGAQAQETLTLTNPGPGSIAIDPAGVTAASPFGAELAAALAVPAQGSFDVLVWFDAPEEPGPYTGTATLVFEGSLDVTGGGGSADPDG